MNALSRTITLTIAAVCWCTASFGAQAVWSNTSGDCLWTNPANWVGSAVPAPGDDVLIPAGAHVTNIYLSGAASPVLGTLVLSNSATLEWYARDGGYVTVAAIIKTNNAVNIRDSNGGFQINGDVMCEVGGPNNTITFQGANQLAGNGRLWKTGFRGLNFNTGGGHASFAGGVTHSNANIIIQSPNSLGQSAYRAQNAGLYPNVLLQLANGEHVISNDFQFDYRSANIGVVLNSSGDINTSQRKITYLGNFVRYATTFGGQYIGLTADRAGYLEFCTNIYAGDWSGFTNIWIRMARGVHIFAAANAVPPASSRLEIEHVNIVRAIEPTPTKVVFAGPYNVMCDILVQFPLSNTTPASVIAANAPGGTVQLGGTIILDNRTNLAVVFEAQVPDTTLEIAGTITNNWPHTVTLRGPGTIVLSAANGNNYTAGTVIKDGATVLGMNANNSCFGPGPVAVEPGSGIGGNGSFAGSLTLDSGAALMPGGSIGTLAIGGNLIAGDGIVYHWEKGGTTADSVAVAGTLGALNGLTVVVFRVGAALPGGFTETNALFTYTGAAPAVNNAVVMHDPGSGWTGGQIGVGGGEVYITGILPEPGTLALAALLAGALLRRSR